jgi:hypothetical protein
MFSTYQSASQEQSPQTAAVLSTFDLLIASHKEMLKYIKILSSYSYCRHLLGQPKPLNIIIKAVQDNMKE